MLVARVSGHRGAVSKKGPVIKSRNSQIMEEAKVIGDVDDSATEETVESADGDLPDIRSQQKPQSITFDLIRRSCFSPKDFEGKSTDQMYHILLFDRRDRSPTHGIFSIVDGS